ncbi:MAG TPA: PstS family phosphate ABC transporter substrate-binding protein [Methanomicrobiales archaeon]|nr:PstS family phosphate ABC transporter substrate-binding protein [Methanomicrobiales archaeon]
MIPMDRTTGTILILVLGLAIVAAGCTSSQTSSQAGAAAESGKITVSGAFALYPMMVTWGEEYHKLHPGITVEVSAGGAGKGMTDALSGMVDLGMVSRAISPDEVAKGAVYVAVTKDAVVVTANAQNPVLARLQVTGVNKSEFRQVFVNETITTWGTLAGTSDTSRIDVYTRSDACGAADVWAKYMGYLQEDLQGVGVYGDPGLADAVRTDRLGIGYNNIGFAYDMNTSRPVEGLAIIPLDVNGNGQVDPDEQFYATKDQILAAINTGKYPSPPARELNLVTKQKFTGITLGFVRWILTDGQKFVPEAGYITLPKERIDEQLAKLGTVQT